MSRARHHMEKECRKDGGRINMRVSGNPDVFKEAEGKESYAEGDEHRKHGGKVHHGKHGKHHPSHPSHPHHKAFMEHMKKGGKAHEFMAKHGLHAEGHKPHHRMDRPKRARGGRVGSDRNPLSSAHHGGAAGERAGGEPD